MNQPATNSLKTDNRFPDCVSIKLHSAPAQPDITSVATPDSLSIDLKLTICFGKQYIQTPSGQVDFGLRRGELSAILLNARIPLERIGLKVPYEVKSEVTDETVKPYQVANWGIPEQPTWEFSMEPYLTGQIAEKMLGKVQVIKEPCAIEATFAVQSQSDIELLDSLGLLRAKHLSPNKTALIAREFFFRFIALELQPYLSKVRGKL